MATPSIAVSHEWLAPGTLPRYLNDEFRSLIDVLDKRDSVIVGGPENLIAILTPMDVLRHLYSVANAFVLIEEIGHALRALIRAATGEGELFRSCVENALSAKYKDHELPRRLEDMTFDDYVALLRDGRSWQYFEAAFGTGQTAPWNHTVHND